MAQVYAHPARWGQRLRVAAWGGAAALLTIPAIAMQFTRDVAWSPLDFLFAAVLMFGSLVVFEWLVRRSGSSAYRIAAALGLLGVFLLVWINAAVGIIGSEDNDANMLFAAVPATGFVVAAIGRFGAAALARASSAMGIVQVLVAATAFSGVAGPIAGSERIVFGVTMVFTALWLTAATLFARAAR